MKDCKDKPDFSIKGNRLNIYVKEGPSKNSTWMYDATTFRMISIRFLILEIRTVRLIASKRNNHHLSCNKWIIELFLIK